MSQGVPLLRYPWARRGSLGQYIPGAAHGAGRVRLVIADEGFAQAADMHIDRALVDVGCEAACNFDSPKCWTPIDSPSPNSGA